MIEEERIKLTVPAALLKMTEGNPGALTVCMKLYQNTVSP